MKEDEFHPFYHERTSLLKPAEIDGVRFLLIQMRHIEVSRAPKLKRTQIDGT